MTVHLGEQNGSGESGTATLTAERRPDQGRPRHPDPVGDDGVRVPQPAHIHKGSCAKLDPIPAYALADVKDGASTSTVDVKLDDLRDGAFAINVHKSAAEIQTYVACGDIGTGKGGSGDSGGSGYGY